MSACFQWPVVVFILALTNVVVGVWAALNESYFIEAVAVLNSAIVVTATLFHSFKRN